MFKGIRSGIFMAFVMLVLAVPALSEAALVTSLDGIQYDMDHSSSFTGGPVVFGDGITYTSTNGSGVFGYDGNYGFVGNGNWTSMNMAGLNTPIGTMTFTFDDPVKGVGGLINYATPGYGTPSIAVYGTDGMLIENSTLSFSISGNNAGQFLGFLESSAIIKSFTLSNAYIGLTDLTVAATPIPGAVWLLGSGILGLVGVRRKMKA